MTTLATDNFNRANSGDLGASWDVMTSETAWTISANTAVPSSLNSDATETYNAATWPNNQWAQDAVTENSVVSGIGPGIALRGSTSARTFYRCVISRAVSGSIELAKFVAGTYTQLGTRTVTWTNGAILYCEVQGTTLIIKLDGVQQGASFSDSAIASGRAGISFSGGTGVLTSIDNWEGGDFAGATSLPPLRRRMHGVLGR